MKFFDNKMTIILSLYISFVFIQSLFFKFTNSIETQYIFNILDQWAGGFGFLGLFSPKGIFSQYVIGTLELISSSFLLYGVFFKSNLMTILGALLAIAVISGAILFHLFTPLGIVVLEDGGLLFAMACGIWLSGCILIFQKKKFIMNLICKRPE